MVVHTPDCQPATWDRRAMLRDLSMEVMPRTLAKVDNVAGLLPPGAQAFIAHIDGTPIEDMVATARRLRDEGLEPVPHFPARIIANRATLADWITRYREQAGITRALVLAGGVARPKGAFDSSMALLDTGLFEHFDRIYVAGHPEGSRDIDPDGSTQNVDAALRWKQDYGTQTNTEMAMVTQFAFDAGPVTAWLDRLREAGITLPVRLGLAGPAKLQTLLKFALACGVGPSLNVLKKRAGDLGQLLTPQTPDALVDALASYRNTVPAGQIEGLHLFPLGGIKASSNWAASSALH